MFEVLSWWPQVVGVLGAFVLSVFVAWVLAVMIALREKQIPTGHPSGGSGSAQAHHPLSPTLADPVMRDV